MVGATVIASARAGPASRAFVTVNPRPPRPRRSRRRGQRGRVRGCCALLAIGAVVCAAAAVLLVRLTATPAFLGGAPPGADDGGSTQAIAARLAGALAVQIGRGSTDPTVTVSDRDLTVIAAAQNPDPRTFTDVQVHTGGGRLLLSARSHLGPLPVIVTVRLTPHLVGGDPQILVDEIDVGNQVLPGFMRTMVDPRGQAVLDVGTVVAAMHLAGVQIGCVAVVRTGVVLGFQRVGAHPDPSACESAA
jgi:hypothetical protein